DVAVVVDFHRLKIRVHPRHELPVALSRPGAHQCQRRMALETGEPDSHVVGDPRFARRIDHAVGKFWHVGARLKADTGLQADHPSNGGKLLEAVEGVEIYDSGHGEPALS